MLIDLKKHIDKEEIEQFPLFVFPGEVIVVDDEAQVDEAVDVLLAHRLIGFDTETRPAFSKGEYYNVSLLQLAIEDRVYLFRLHKCGFQPSLCRLLADSRVVKIGVSVRDDIRNLKKMKEFTPAAFIDLQSYVEKFGIEEKSFSKLMAIIFSVRISKRQRKSNWETPELSEAQIRYAATDAWGSLRMYQRLSSGG